MMTNLDVKCAEVGMKLAQIKKLDERLLNNALGVLQEQGLYACFLYLHAQKKDYATEISKHLFEFLREIPDLNLANRKDRMLEQVAELAEDLDKLLFARELLLQALVYARYHLKAKSGGER